MKIKLSALKSELKHSQEFDKEILSFIKQIEEQIGNDIELANLDDYDCDLKLIFIETGGSEGLFIKSIDKLKEPYYLLTNKGNNSLAASLEILTYLKSINKKGEIIHGDIHYTAKRIYELGKINEAINSLNDANYGVIGKPSDWLISSIPDYSAVKNKLGINLSNISLSEIEEHVLNTGNLNHDIPKLGFNENEVNKAYDIYQAMNILVDRYNLKGLTIRCFDLLSSLKNTGCLGLAYLNSLGIIGTCEGDVMAMISMAIIQKLTGQSSFQANPSSIDVENKEIILAHCTAPFDMLDSYTLDTHFESGIGVAIKGKLNKQKVTIFRLTADLSRFFLATGTIVENLEKANLCRTQIKVKMDDDIASLLTNPCGNHHIVVYGDHKELIKTYLEMVL